MTHIFNARIGFARPFLIALLLVAFWLVAGWRGWTDPLIFPPLPSVLRTYVAGESASELWQGLAISMVRLVIGGMIGIAIGLALGMAMGLSRVFEALVAPTFHGFRQIALFAWIPLLTAWLGADEAAKITFVVLATMKPVAMGTLEGIQSVNLQHLDVGRALCFSRARTLRQIMLPAALPSIAGGLQLGLIHGWMATVGAEYLLGSFAPGIGAFVVEGRERMAMDQVFAGIIAIAVIGLVLNVILRRVAGRAMLWKGDD